MSHAHLRLPRGRQSCVFDPQRVVARLLVRAAVLTLLVLASVQSKAHGLEALGVAQCTPPATFGVAVLGVVIAWVRVHAVEAQNRMRVVISRC